MDNKKFQDLLTSVDVLNTLHGGISEPVLSLRQQSSGREVRVRVPGIDKETLQVEVHNNMLSVFYLIPIDTAGKVINMPLVVYNKAIPYFIDISAIKAVFEADELVVQLPYNKLSSGYNKKIQIGEE
ncbi:Hsp20/alpha crystallin family protein [Ohtaekwangia koreensis]|uniref:HSP20 family protein n=1 Tax=Ohtaekwangia koreensis TaxID=688867 RepID=A0A1T5LSA0_9BACT|nr:Hsp20/alpha crystallin family protein [Ohtaekwangia koreensis]SKC78754.1 HSP20 family protein [Ohtaekwangia koreensis]